VTPNTILVRTFEMIRDGVRERPWTGPLILAFGAGLLALLLTVSADSFWSSLGKGFLLAGASLLTGALLGFLFGIPKVIQAEGRTEQENGRETQYRVNTNLEQISDWLTKIIVGLGLVTLATLPDRFYVLATACGEAIGRSAGIAGAIIVHFALAGFLSAYLWTRLMLTIEFSRADRSARDSPWFYEGLIQALLYQPPPDGFTSAIRNGEQYLLWFGESNWRVWRALACAFAQKFRYLDETRTDPLEKGKARDAALDALRRLLAINPAERESMRNLWDPARVSPQEDDLVVFHADLAFRELLMRPEPDPLVPLPPPEPQPPLGPNPLVGS
jgi:hypothetical protein